MLRMHLMIGCLILVTAPMAFCQHANPPPKPPRNMMIDLSVERARRARLDKSDYDNKQQNIKMTISMYNRTSQDYNGLTDYLYVLAQHVVRKNEYKLIIKEQQALDLPRGQRFQRESTQVVLRFDDHEVAKFGFKYFGHVYLVEDKDGKLLMGDASSDKLWAQVSKLAGKKLGEVFSF
jgi:hypothetical protein